MQQRRASRLFYPGDWPIGVKLLLGFGLMALVTLGLAAVNLYNFISIQRTVDKALQEGLQIQTLSTQIQNNLAAARQNEQAFLLHWQDEGYEQAFNAYLIPFGEHVADIHSQVDTIEHLIADQPHLSPYAQEAPRRLKSAVDTYRSEFIQVADLLRQRGDQDGGTIGELEGTADRLSLILFQVKQPELHNAFLQLRLNEMLYRLHGDQQARNQTRVSLAQLQVLVEWLTPEIADQTLPLLERYEQAFNELVALDTAIAQHTAAYTEAVNEVQVAALEVAAAGTTLADADLSGITAGIQRASRLALSAVALSLLLSVLLAWLFTRQIARPIQSLAETARRIEGGDMTAQAPIRSQDEIGVLAQTFNSMAAQIGDLIAGLELQVAQRTQDLERRAALLEIAADVGRTVASILELDLLTRRIVELVRERFDLYYAGLFLVDEAGEYAVLAAGTGEAGRVMREQGYKLRIGGASMVGTACAQKEVRIALDVADPPTTAEVVRFDNPLLPDTRSEMALPLIVGERVLGALDVQSTEPAAFSQEDITVLQLVADQVAIAIDNARKFSEEATLLEATSPIFRLSRRLTTVATTEDVIQTIIQAVADTDADGCMIARFGFVRDQIATITFLGEWRRHGNPQIPIGQPFPMQDNVSMEALTTFWMTEDIQQDNHLSPEFRQFLIRRDVQAVGNIPLRVGQRAIGFIVVFRSIPGPFSAVDIQLYTVLADQAALALERTRLLEETQQRAERERIIRNLSDRLTSAFALDTILQTAVEGLSSMVKASGGYIELKVGEER